MAGPGSIHGGFYRTVTRNVVLWCSACGVQQSENFHTKGSRLTAGRPAECSPLEVISGIQLCRPLRGGGGKIGCRTWMQFNKFRNLPIRQSSVSTRGKWLGRAGVKSFRESGAFEEAWISFARGAQKLRRFQQRYHFCLSLIFANKKKNI